MRSDYSIVCILSISAFERQTRRYLKIQSSTIACLLLSECMPKTLIIEIDQEYGVIRFFIGKVLANELTHSS